MKRQSCGKWNLVLGLLITKTGGLPRIFGHPKAIEADQNNGLLNVSRALQVSLTKN
jgi:hypothetical protein